MPNVSGIGRALDPNVASNRAAILGTVLAGAGTLAVRVAVRRDAPLRAAAASAESAFTAWAIGRELDPDGPSTATLAMPIALTARSLGRPSLGSSAPAVIAARLTAGTVGAPLGVAEGAQIAGMAVLAGARASTWPAIGTLAVGIAVDRGLGDRTLLGVAATLVAGAAGAIAARARPRPGGFAAQSVGWLAATGAAWAITRHAGAIRSRSDAGDQPLDARRISLARGLTMASVVVAAALDGRRGLVATVPLAAALIGTAATRLAARLDGPEGRSTPLAKAPTEVTT